MNPTERQHREPGVRYKRVRGHRQETTVIDGKSSTRRVRHDTWEPRPPREWDEAILRALTCAAVAFVLVAVVATAASIGGLLTPLVPSFIAYGMGGMFTLAWVYCLGIEWLNRISPQRARPAQIAGWVALLVSMGAVYTYGNTLGHQEAGVVGAAVDLVAKGMWWLLMRHHAVPLEAGVAHWVADQEQQLAGRALLAARLTRLNRRAAYERAIGGREYEAAGAILATEHAPLPAAQQHPAPPAAEPPSAPAAPEPGHGDQEAQKPPKVTQITLPRIVDICREQMADDSDVTDDALYAAVLAAGHIDRPSLYDTVRRTAQRIDPNRRKIS